MGICVLLAYRLGVNLQEVFQADPARVATAAKGGEVGEGGARDDSRVLPGDPARRPRGSTPWSERAVILQRNLFHDPFAGTRATAATEPAEVLEATELPLGLLGTIASTDSDIGAAAVWNAEQKRRVVVTEGDELAGGEAVVVGIERRRLLLSEDGVVRELVLGENEDIRPPKRPVRRRGRFGRRRAGRR